MRNPDSSLGGKIRSKDEDDLEILQQKRQSGRARVYSEAHLSSIFRQNKIERGRESVKGTTMIAVPPRVCHLLITYLCCLYWLLGSCSLSPVITSWPCQQTPCRYMISAQTRIVAQAPARAHTWKLFAFLPVVRECLLARRCQNLYERPIEARPQIRACLVVS